MRLYVDFVRSSPSVTRPLCSFGHTRPKRLKFLNLCVSFRDCTWIGKRSRMKPAIFKLTNPPADSCSSRGEEKGQRSACAPRKGDNLTSKRALTARQHNDWANHLGPSSKMSRASGSDRFRAAVKEEGRSRHGRWCQIVCCYCSCGNAHKECDVLADWHQTMALITRRRRSNGI